MKRCVTCNHTRVEHRLGVAWLSVPIRDPLLGPKYRHQVRPCPGFVDPAPWWLRILYRLRTMTKGPR